MSETRGMGEDFPAPESTFWDGSWRVMPKHGRCFVCDRDNPGGLGIDYESNGKRVRAEVTFTDRQQGPPGHAHGGSLAAAVDEAMGVAAWITGNRVVAAELTVRYRKATPLGVPMLIEAWIEGDEAGKVRTAAEVRLPDGSVCIEGHGLFIHAPHYFGGG